MNFQQLRFVREAVRNGLNLTMTSSALFTSQSGVSRRIKDLEDELGVEIFVRRGKRLVGLTKIGQGVLPFIEKILLEAENLRRYSDHFNERRDGRLVVAATHDQARHILPDVIRDYIYEFPNVQLELRQGTPQFVAQNVVDGEADVGIATEALDDFPELVTHDRFSWRQVAIVPIGHPLTEIGAISLADLARYPLMVSDFAGGEAIDADMLRVRAGPDIRLAAMDADVIKAYVELGLGIGVIAEFAFDPARDRMLTILAATKALFEPGETKLVTRRGVLLPSYADRLIELYALKFQRPEITSPALREPTDVAV